MSEGSDQAFDVVADPCHSIADVLVDGSSVGAVASYTFTNVTADHTIEASFTHDIYGIFASAGTGGSISPSGNNAAECGTNLEFTMTPDACYAVANVIIDGTSVGPMTSYTFEDIQTPHTISVTFSATGPFTIAASASANGSITPSGDVSVTCASDQSFSILPDPCYDIADVLVDGGSVGAVTGYTFTNVAANHTIDASFRLRAYAIAASAGTGGSISPSGNVGANCGSNAEFTITPNACYAVQDVLVDGVSVGAMTSYTFEDVQTPHTIAATFVVATTATSTTLDASQNPSACQGSLTLTAHTTPVLVSGSVEFFDGTTSLGTGTVLDSEAMLTLPTGLSVGDHTLSATFTPAGCYVASSSAAVPHTVVKAAVAVTLTPDVNPSTWGQAVTFTASVTPSTATGRITFKDSLTVLGIVDLVAGEAQIVKSNFYCGNHTQVTATFSDDGCYDHGTSAPLSQAVHRAPSALSMTSDLNPNTWGETVKLIGTVTPTGGTNRVTFYVDGNPIGTAAVNFATGEAKLNVSNMLAGDHELTASYAGDTHFSPSATAGAYDQTVMANPRPQVTVMYPNGGEDLDVGSNVDLMWSATDNSAVVSVSLEVSRNNGATWDPIATDIANTGTHSWTVPSPGTNTDATKVYCAMFRVTAKDDAGDDGADVSNTGFSLFDLQSGVVVTALDAVSLDDGVQLSWSITNRPMFARLALERSPAEAGPWTPLSTDLRDDAGLTVAEDRTADAGQTYFYRLVGTTQGGTQAVFGLVRGTAGAPKEFAMSATWPNPTRGPLSLVIAVSRTAHVKLSVVDLQGREVATLANDAYTPGRYRVDWDGRTDRGPVPAGLYFLTYVTPDSRLVKRVAITR